MRLLVVEDDLALSSLLVRALREEAYAVDLAQDGQEAEWLAYENPYDVIILDIMLPIKDGLTVLKNLREGGIKTPVLFLTAKDSKEDVVKGLDIGGDDYITKPIQFNLLAEKLQSLVLLKENSEE